MTQIIDAYLGLTALRQAGYRSTATAVAELVDNSIEANAVDIEIIALSKEILISKRKSNQVQQVAVLDNGAGMVPEVLQNCLSLGWGTRLETRDGLGRFGFGLKGASISQARRVEVYSWVDSGAVYRAYMDLDEIKDNNSQALNSIEEKNIPSNILRCFGSKLGKSGTLVLWDDLDQMDLKYANTLLKRINKELCRIYRHFLDDCDHYGKKRNINLHKLQIETGAVESISLKANDPLYLLVPNNLEGFSDEATNVLTEEPFSIDVKYKDGFHESISKVWFRFTIAKPNIQNLGGNSVVGKHYADNTGISVVRAGREIDFGSFGFLDASEPRHRWWGAEIRFDPVLDEYFGVTNNKQEVRSIRKLDIEMIDHLTESAEYGDDKSWLLVEINKILSGHIKKIMKEVTGRRSKGGKKKPSIGSLVGKVNEDISTDNTPTQSEQHSKSLTEDEKVKQRVSLLLADDLTLSEEEAAQEAVDTIDYRVDITTDDWPGDLFLDRKPVANASVGIINRSSLFYEKFWRYLEEHDDKKGHEALEIMMISLIRAEDELATQVDPKLFERFRQKWGTWLEHLLEHAGS